MDFNGVDRIESSGLDGERGCHQQLLAAEQGERGEAAEQRKGSRVEEERVGMGGS